MKQVSKLSLLTLALLMASCNEKVSPELQEGSVSTPGDTSTPVAPTEYYFAVEDSSDPLLNYKLHKTGAGNRNTKCEVRSTSKLSSDNFRGNPALHDISCFFEAEELSLLHSGFNFKVKASKNTCDFVGYMPYGFYTHMPGSSSGTYYQVTCGNETTNSSHVTPSATALGLDLRDRFGNVIGCNDWLIDGAIINQSERERFQVSTDEEMCRFNYNIVGGGSAMCDVGEITVNEVVINFTPATDTSPSILKQEIVPRVISCGGEIHNCVQGPTKDLKANATRTIENTRTALNQDFEKEYKYDKSIDFYGNSIFFANYRRNLANYNIEYGTSTGLTGAYRSAWADPLHMTNYQPRLVDYFSANLMLDNATPLVSSTRLEQEARRTRKWYAKPLAADPFLGLEERVNPFYTFYCFDTAYDIKARIRMVVRDWDRVHQNGAELELLSDLFKNSNGQQDAPNLVELPDDTDTYISFNDRQDWDDLIPMVRTNGSFDPFSTIWAPVGTPLYPDGWFNPGRFPRIFMVE